jgi:hypothetical protein
MIEPTTSDIGRGVIYTGNRYPGGKLEEGVITSFNDYAVFVRYGADKGSKATSRADLEWLRKNEEISNAHLDLIPEASEESVSVPKSGLAKP